MGQMTTTLLKESIQTAITCACFWVLSHAENGYFVVSVFWKAKFGTQYQNILMTYSMFLFIQHIYTCLLYTSDAADE